MEEISEVLGLWREAGSVPGVSDDPASLERLLETSEDVIKTRLHRAKAALRDRMNELLDAQTREAFAFHAVRCDRVVNAVMKRIREG